MQLLGVAAVMLVLVRTTGQPKVQAGEIYAMIAYLWRVLESLDDIPLIVQQIGRLLDIRRRIAQAGAA